MEIRHMNQRQLANRWGVSDATLERWRAEGTDSQFLKLRGCEMYRECDIEEYEEQCLRISTSIPVKGCL